MERTPGKGTGVRGSMELKDSLGSVYKEFYSSIIIDYFFVPFNDHVAGIVRV